MSVISARQVNGELLTTDASKTAPGPYDALGKKIVNAADPIDLQDAVTLGYLRRNTLVAKLPRQMSIVTANFLPPVVGVRDRYEIPLGSYYRDPAVVTVGEGSVVVMPAYSALFDPTIVSVGFPTGWTGGKITVYGTNSVGAPISEVFSAAPGSVVTGSTTFYSVTGAQNDALGAAAYKATVFVPSRVDFALFMATSPKGPILPRVYGVHYTALRRRPQASTATVEDIATGVQFTDPPLSAGIGGYFQWNEPHLLVDPPTIAQARVDIIAAVADNIGAPSLPTAQPISKTTAAVSVAPGWLGGNVVVAGENPIGTPVSESFTPPPGGGTVYGTVIFERVTNVSHTLVGGTGTVASVFTPNSPSKFDTPWWVSPASTTYPNAIRVPAYDDFQIEFWRRSFVNGGVRGVDPNRTRMGRRYMPYRRMPIGEFTTYMGSLASTDPYSISSFTIRNQMKPKQFKVCYYDPRSGARSALSSDIIVLTSSNGDRSGGGLSMQHHALSVWVR